MSPEVGEMGAAPPDGGNLTRATLSGLRWSYLAAVTNGVLLAVYTAVMSRVLTPTVFGLMAVATITVNFGQYFAKMGVAHALIQKPHIDDGDVRASATSSTLLGLFVATAVFTGAPLIASLFREPDVVPLLRVLSLTFVFMGLSMTSVGLLRRQLRFKAIATINVSTAIVSNIGGIVLALAGAGVWSLVFVSLFHQVFSTVLQYSLVRHPLRPLFAWRRVRTLYSYGARISLLRFQDFLGSNLDTLAVARYLAAASVGFYNRAFYLVSLPLQRYLASALTQVLFPGFAAVQQDPERLRRAYLTTVSLAAAVLVPVCVGIGIAGPEMVATVLGGQWDAAVVLIAPFAIAGGLNILTKFTTLACEAVAKLNANIAIQVSYLVVLAGLLLVAATIGELWAFAAALALGETLRHIAFLVLAHRVFAIDWSRFAGAYGPALFIGAVTAVLMGGGRWALLEAGLPRPVIFVALVALGGLGLWLGVRFNPSRSLTRELRGRARMIGVDVTGSGAKAKVARAVLGTPHPERSLSGGAA